MGKIFDALEKSKKKVQNSTATEKRPDDDAKSMHKKQGSAIEDKVVSLKKKPDVPSRKALNKETNRRDKKQASPPVAREVKYNGNKIDKHLVALLKPRAFEAEQFKMLRTNLMFPVSGKSPRSIIVTSAAPSEGKSFVAANLAVTIAQNIQEHVLLIDSDIRKPCIHKRFGYSDVPGLSEHLSEGTPISSLLLKTEINKLSILPAGKPPHNPSELLTSQKMLRLLGEVRDRYHDRYVIIDTPPPKLTAETSAMSRKVDGVLLVVEYGGTPREMVSDLVELIGKEKILGIIFNKHHMALQGYYGFGKYGKYGKYYGS